MIDEIGPHSSWPTAGGIPVGTLAIGKPGATNAALLAIAILALNDPGLHKKLETFRADKVTFAAKPSEGHQRLTLEGRWRAEPRDVGAGALFVPIAQPKARLVMALLEPQAPDSLAAWGEFNGAFEAKEYMEPYVAEEVARAMLADPAVASAFAKKLAAEPEFAKDPQARLDFFYRRHPSWDERLDLYPVMRAASPPP